MEYLGFFWWDDAVRAAHRRAHDSGVRHAVRRGRSGFWLVEKVGA